jgi:DNA-binding transcriptional LysR family regulator
MDSNRLRYFLVVAETESLRKAAEALHISAGALSKAIKQLEYETGITLLVPAGRGIVITKDGRELARRGQPLLEGLDRLKNELKEKQQSSGNNTRPIRIGSFEVFTTHFLSGLMEYIPANKDLLLREVIPGEMEQSLLADEIDYGITYMPIPTAGISHQQISFVAMSIFGQADIFEHVPFSKLPFVIPVLPLSGSPNRVQGLDGWPDGQVERLIRYRVTMMESALELCRQGKAVAYLPGFVVSLHNNTVKSTYNLQAIPFPESMLPQKQAVYLARRKADPDDNVCKKIIYAMRMICQVDHCGVLR